MSAQGPHGAELEVLRDTLERRILERTWGRIHQLEVGAEPDRVSVAGYAPSYYVKQLAIQAILEVLGPAGLPAVALRIVVGPGEPAADGRRDYRRGSPARPHAESLAGRTG